VFDTSVNVAEAYDSEVHRVRDGASVCAAPSKHMIGIRRNIESIQITIVSLGIVSLGCKRSTRVAVCHGRVRQQTIGVQRNVSVHSVVDEPGPWLKCIDLPGFAS